MAAQQQIALNLIVLQISKTDRDGTRGNREHSGLDTGEAAMKRATGLLAVMTAGLWGVAGVGPAIAAEGATGFYLLGSRTSMAGFVPPPGTYVQSSNYLYSGSTSAELNFAGLTIAGGVDADAFYSMPTVLWVAPGTVMGGNLALSATAPIGWKDVSAGVSLTGPNGGVISVDLEDEETKFGDPVLGATLGWHQGKYHWNVGTLINAPAGFWERGNLANIGFNRWAFDVNAAVTHLDQSTGLELSSAVGLTFNVENPDTDYKTGTEFHLELAAMQNFSKTFAAGISGYYYEQITGDSGSGARLGDFEGRVFGLGPAINWTFLVGKIPVTTNLKYFREFGARNRLEGDAGFVTLTMPLSAESE